MEDNIFKSYPIKTVVIENDVSKIEVDGVYYSREVFALFGSAAKVGTIFKFIEKGSDGVITIETLQEPEQKKPDSCKPCFWYLPNSGCNAVYGDEACKRNRHHKFDKEPF